MKEIGLHLLKFKKRNRIKQQKMDQLVFVQYNMRLRQEQLKRNAQHYDPINVDHILLDSAEDERLSATNDERNKGFEDDEFA